MERRDGYTLYVACKAFPSGLSGKASFALSVNQFSPQQQKLQHQKLQPGVLVCYMNLFDVLSFFKEQSLYNKYPFLSSFQKKTYSKMNNPAIQRIEDQIVKSPEDKREYRGLELANGIKVLLISDPTTDKSSAALDVHIGTV